MEKNEGKKKAAKNEGKLSPAMIAKITELAANAAVEAYMEQLILERAKFRDRRFNNAKLLLRKYRWLCDYSSKAVYEASQMMDGNMEAILEALGADMAEVRKVQSIKKNVEITSIIMEHVESMIQCYKEKCTSSPKPEVNRRWRVLYALYLADEPFTPKEIANVEHISLRQVYGDIDNACEDLSTLFFGLDLSHM